MKFSALVVAVVLAGCGGTNSVGTGGGNNQGTGGGSSGFGGGTGIGLAPELDREALSGTRLKNRYLQGDDGSKSLLGFFDTTRNEACSFQVAEDGKQRCLPWESAAYFGFFFDAACSERVAYSPQSCAGLKYAFDTQFVCPYRMLMYDATEYTPTQIFGGSATSCSKLTTIPPYTYYRVGAKIAATSFAGATVMVEP